MHKMKARRSRPVRQGRGKPEPRAPTELTEAGKDRLEQWREQVLNAGSMSAIAPIAEAVQAYGEADRIEILKNLARELKEDSLPLIRELAKSTDRDLLLGTLEAASQVRSEESVEIISPLAEDSQDGQVRKAARRALEHLRSLGIRATVPMGGGLMTAVLAPERFQEALLSSINGLGQRMVSLAQRIPGAGIAVAQIAVDDSRGVYDVATGVSNRSNYERLMTAMRLDPARAFVPVPWAYAVQQLREARELNARTGTPVPDEFTDAEAIWSESPEESARPMIYEQLNTDELTDNKLLLAEGEKLLDEDIFEFWVIPREQLQPILEKAKQAEESWVVVPEAAQKDRIQSIVKEGAEQIFDETGRARYKRRLEEMSYVLFESGKSHEARVALATGIAIGSPEVPLTSIAFVNALMQRSLELAMKAAPSSEEEEAAEKSSIIVPFRDLSSGMQAPIGVSEQAGEEQI